MAVSVIRTGTWLYDGSVEMPVDVIAFDYDWWYVLAEADDQLEEGESPIPLGPNGFLYYVRFRHAGDEVEPTWPDSGGYTTIEEAMSYAESKTVSGVRWSSAT